MLKACNERSNMSGAGNRTRKGDKTPKIPGMISALPYQAEERRRHKRRPGRIPNIQEVSGKGLKRSS